MHLDRSTSPTRRSSTRASTRGPPPSRTPPGRGAPGARPTAAARARRTAASSRASAWCWPTSRAPAWCATSGSPCRRPAPSACGRSPSRCATRAGRSRASRRPCSTSSGSPTAGRWRTTRSSPPRRRAAGSTRTCPMPFRERIEIAFTNHSEKATTLYYQVDYTLQPEVPAELGYLHVAFRRENPTVQKRDFVITEGLEGAGPVPRLRGGRAGDRPRQLVRRGRGEGVQATATPTSRRSAAPGLEDYVGSAWGMGQHDAPYAGAHLVLSGQGKEAEGMGTQPDFVSFYRWHVPDPIMFERDLKVTIQQIGAMFFLQGQEAEKEAYDQTNPVAGEGWQTDGPPGAARLGDLRAGRRLLVHLLRVLPGAAGRAARRRGGRRRRHRTTSVRGARPHGSGRRSRGGVMHHLTDTEQRAARAGRLRRPRGRVRPSPRSTP